MSSNGDAAVFTAIPKTAPSAYATQDVVNDLRDNVLPAAPKGTGLTAFVGGTTASYIDLADLIGEKLPSVIVDRGRARVPAADARVPLARRAR